MKRKTTLAILTVLALAVDGTQLRADPIPQRRIQQSERTTSPSVDDSNDVGKSNIGDLDIAEGTTIEQALNLMKTKVIGFQYVIRKGPWQNEKLPKIHLKNVSLGTALQVLMNYSSKFSIRDISPGPLFGEDGARQRIFVASPGGGSADADVVQVFSLSPAIDRQTRLDGLRTAQGPASEARKHAMTAVLSLIENVLKLSDTDAPNPSLSVHDETEALIVHGVNARVEEVGRILAKLAEPVDQSELHRLQSERAILLRQIDSQAQMIRDAKEAAEKTSRASQSK